MRDRITEKDFVMGKVNSVEALLGTVHEKRAAAWHDCRGSSCNHGSHRPDPRVFLSDSRKDGKYKSGHHDGEWICFYSEPTLALMDAYGRYDGDFRLSMLQLINWADGRTVLIGSPRCGIGSTFLDYEQVQP